MYKHFLSQEIIIDIYDYLISEFQPSTDVRIFLITNAKCSESEKDFAELLNIMICQEKEFTVCFECEYFNSFQRLEKMFEKIDSITRMIEDK